MKSIIIVLAVSLLSFSACTKSGSKSTELKAENTAPAKFEIDSVSIDDSIKIKDSLQIKFTSKLLVFPDLKDREFLDSIYFNYKELKDFSKQGLQAFLVKRKDEYFNSIENDQELLSNVIYSQQWYTNTQMNLKSNTNDFLHIQYAYHSYGGGAHDNYSFSERVFDLKNKKKLELKDITTMPKARLEGLLKRNINMVPSGTEDTQGAVKNSDMLLVDVIPASDNFYFDEKNLYFHYSPYEIAAFAAGDIIIPVSWEDLKMTLVPQFKERMKNFQ